MRALTKSPLHRFDNQQVSLVRSAATRHLSLAPKYLWTSFFPTYQFYCHFPKPTSPPEPLLWWNPAGQRSASLAHRHLCVSPASNVLSFTEPILQNNGGNCRNHRLQRLNQPANSQLSECKELSQTPLKHLYRSSKETFTTHLPHSHSAQDIHTIQDFKQENPNRPVTSSHGFGLAITLSAEPMLAVTLISGSLTSPEQYRAQR